MEKQKQTIVKIAGNSFPAEKRVDKKGRPYWVARVKVETGGLWPATEWKVPTGKETLSGLEIRLLRIPEQYMPTGETWFPVGDPVAGSQLWVNYREHKNQIKLTMVNPGDIELLPRE